MPRLGLNISKKKGSATFHVDEDFSQSWRRRNRTSMGPARTLFSGLSLSLGIASLYVALHYIPAFMSPSQIVRASNLDEERINKDRGAVMQVVGPYWDALQSRKSYIWAGEKLEVQYKLAEGQTMELVIKRCARQYVVELFDCKVLNQQVLTVDRRLGMEKLYFAEPGFYHFEERFAQGPRPRVIWRRA